MTEYLDGKPLGTETAVIVGLVHGEQTADKLDEYLDELEFLASTAGAKTAKRFTQKLKHPDSKYFVGSGKLAEIVTYVHEHDVDMVCKESAAHTRKYIL